MDILSIIDKKRQGKPLTKQEIDFVINEYVKTKTITDYQVSALLMAITINGMNEEEIFYLNDAMLHSGKIISFKNAPEIKIDKHSTGGVGDKVSLILAPICVALGIKVSKMSGRGLGHTGGTIDKLESIGVNCDIPISKFSQKLKQVGMFIASQTDDVVVADKLLYSLRNASGTVQSLPLIATSVASKKLAVGSDYIFLDVKYGSGAFCKNITEASKLSQLLINLFKRYHRVGVVHITNMDQPLGRAIGNAIEVKAAIDFLKGNPESDTVKDLIYAFVSDVLITIKKAKTKVEASKLINRVIGNGSALKAFYKWVVSQGARMEKLLDEKFFAPKYQRVVKAHKNGYVNYLSSKAVGLVAFQLGAGRLRKTDQIDYQAGIWLNKIQNEYVNQGETIATLYASKSIKQSMVINFLSNTQIMKKKIKALPLIAKVVK